MAWVSTVLQFHSTLETGAHHWKRHVFVYPQSLPVLGHVGFTDVQRFAWHLELTVPRRVGLDDCLLLVCVPYSGKPWIPFISCEGSLPLSPIFPRPIPVPGSECLGDFVEVVFFCFSSLLFLVGFREDTGLEVSALLSLIGSLLDFLYYYLLKAAELLYKKEAIQTCMT